MPTKYGFVTLFRLLNPNGLTYFETVNVAELGFRHFWKDELRGVDTDVKVLKLGEHGVRIKN